MCKLQCQKINKNSNAVFLCILWCILRGSRTFHGVTTFGRRSGVWQLGKKTATSQIGKRSNRNATEVSLLFLYHACGLLPGGRNTGTCEPVLCQHFLFFERSRLTSICSCGEVSLDDIEHGFLRARPDYFEASQWGVHDVITGGIWKIMKLLANHSNPMHEY